MDSSYWTNQEVIKASRDFVCIRLATYEDKKEVEFLKGIFRGRSGDLENTTFVILDSDGKKRLSRSGRSPDFAFRGANAFVTGLNKIAKEKNSAEKRFSDANLPLIKNVDLALNVASCDQVQLVVVVGENEQKMNELAEKAAPLAWNEKVGGQFLFAKTCDPKELLPINGKPPVNGLIVVEPGQFGMTGKIVESFGEKIEFDRFVEKLAEHSATYEVLKDYRQHVQAGIQLGIKWESETPVTDQGSLRAVERSRGGR
ncbi:MAG: thioredoxin family protein [Pirellulaceae bacterium]|nr:thioredoxin family protein [Pirellulaceae bacterium]